jgi:hypothetical protein
MSETGICSIAFFTRNDQKESKPLHLKVPSFDRESFTLFEQKRDDIQKLP